jgi:prepilin-type processing-associated H-X9-DG protein
MVGPLWPYIKNAKVYKCCADHSYITAPSGEHLDRVRTISMNFFLGGFAGDYGGYGPAQPMELYFKLADLNGAKHSPGPAKTFLFLDEREDVINWGNFMTDMAGYSPSNPNSYTFDQDLPGMYHNRACGFSFCDGHAEIHRWLDQRTMPPIQYQTYVIQTWPVPRDQDVAWLQDRTTRPK